MLGGAAGEAHWVVRLEDIEWISVVFDVLPGSFLSRLQGFREFRGLK